MASSSTSAVSVVLVPEQVPSTGISKKKNKIISSYEKEAMKFIYLQNIDNLVELGSETLKPVYTRSDLAKISQQVLIRKITNNFEVLFKNRKMSVVVRRNKESDPIIELLAAEDSFDILMEAHEVTQHGGTEEMMEYIKPKFLVAELCITYFLTLCAYCKPQVKPTEYKNKSEESPKAYPFNTVSEVYIVDMYESSDNFRYLLVYIDLPSSFTILRPIVNLDETEVLIEILKIFSDFGTPAELRVHEGHFQFIKKILSRLDNIVPTEEIILTYDTQNPMTAVKVVSKVKKLIKATNVTSGAIACHKIQWHLNNTPTEDSETMDTPYFAVFAVEPNKIDPFNPTVGTNKDQTIGTSSTRSYIKELLREEDTTSTNTDTISNSELNMTPQEESETMEIPYFAVCGVDPNKDGFIHPMPVIVEDSVTSITSYTFQDIEDLVKTEPIATKTYSDSILHSEPTRHPEILAYVNQNTVSESPLDFLFKNDPGDLVVKLEVSDDDDCIDFQDQGVSAINHISPMQYSKYGHDNGTEDLAQIHLIQCKKENTSNEYLVPNAMQDVNQVANNANAHEMAQIYTIDAVTPTCKCCCKELISPRYFCEVCKLPMHLSCGTVVGTRTNVDNCKELQVVCQTCPKGQKKEHKRRRKGTLLKRQGKGRGITGK